MHFSINERIFATRTNRTELNLRKETNKTKMTFIKRRKKSEINYYMRKCMERAN